MVLALLYTTTKRLLIPAALQLATVSLILSKLFNAVLAVVVIQTARIALGSNEGVGFTGLIGGVGVLVLSAFLEQAVILKISPNKSSHLYACM